MDVPPPPPPTDPKPESADDWPASAEDDPRLRIPDELTRPIRRPASGADPAMPDKMWSDTAKAWGLALDFVFTILVGAGLGWLFDRWRQTAPWGVLAGLVIGFAGAFFRIVRHSIRADREESGRRASGRGTGDDAGRSGTS